MNEHKVCPNCGVSLEGELIYETYYRQHEDEAKALEIAEMYGATKTEGRWGRALGHYDQAADRTVGYECPDCHHYWKR